MAGWNGGVQCYRQSIEDMHPEVSTRATQGCLATVAVKDMHPRIATCGPHGVGCPCYRQTVKDMRPALEEDGALSPRPGG
jgi:hypothetical protein